MKAAYELTMVFLRLWLFGVIVIHLFSLSDFWFRRPHSVWILVRRLGFAYIWPLALASEKGRNSLLGKFKGL